jgi:hypothetical protein
MFRPDDPHFWRAKLVKNGPWVGVMTWTGAPYIEGEEQDRSHRPQALVRTETTARALLYGDPCPIEIEGMMLRNIERITEAEWKFLIEHSAWATQHAPHMPDAAPRTAIDKRGRSVF